MYELPRLHCEASFVLAQFTHIPVSERRNENSDISASKITSPPTTTSRLQSLLGHTTRTRHPHTIGDTGLQSTHMASKLLVEPLYSVCNRT
jgi:hypothetical protein